MSAAWSYCCVRQVFQPSTFSSPERFMSSGETCGIGSGVGAGSVVGAEIVASLQALEQAGHSGKLDAIGQRQLLWRVGGHLFFDWLRHDLLDRGRRGGVGNAAGRIVDVHLTAPG